MSCTAANDSGPAGRRVSTRTIWKLLGPSRTPLISPTKSQLQLLAVAETGDAVVLVSNGRLECYESGKAEALWTWQTPGDSTSLQTFLGNECPLTNEITGSVLLSASNDIRLYSLSPNAEPALLTSLPLVDVCSSQRDLIATEKVICCYRRTIRDHFSTVKQLSHRWEQEILGNLSTPRQI